ncbi:endo-1,4-beta-xylanase [Halocatena halophila]|uniref:endo-1,4-beta-xylanase n=1 Tax=Halocatena halophila TaxID=2814576 RepID=UPI002ED20397
MTGDTQPPKTDESTATDTGVGFDRRAFLRAVGALALSAGLTGSAAGETADTSKTVAERIDEHRTGTLEVTVEREDGTVVPDAQVEVTMLEHDFDFGTAVNANTLLNESSVGDNYRTYIPELFNTAVLENRHKWRFFETEGQLADDATDWLLGAGLDVRGHVCIWGSDGVSAIPDDVQTAIDNGDAQTIRDRSMAHIEEIITHYGEDITEWEVVNEAMHAYQLQRGVYGDQIDTEEPWTGEVIPWSSQLLTDWYTTAEAVIESNDLDVGIGVNDFNQFAYDYVDGRYETQIDHLQSSVDLDTIGLQAHVAARTGENDTNSNPDARISASQVAAEINQWADHGARVKITEFDMYNGDDWTDDEERATVLENYLRGAFSHPGVDAFIMWGFWDGRHWENEAPLFYQDWSPKPAYDVWNELVFGEWWTSEGGLTDSDGTYSTAVYLGDHEITVSTDTDSTTATVSATDAGTPAAVTVTVSGDGTGEDTTPPATPSGLSVPETTAETVTLSWEAATDTGGSGLDQYVVTVDGTTTQTVPAGTTQTTLSGLTPETTYSIGVSAVDGAGNESAATTTTATTDAGSTDPPGDVLVIDDFDGDPGWSANRNDLGEWCGAGSFENGSGSVSDGALLLEYDNGGWFQTQLNQDISEYATLVLRLRGANGGEESEVLFDMGGVRTLLSTVTDDSITTSFTDVAIDLEAAGVDRTGSSLSLRLNFWQGGSGTIEIEEIRLE